MTRQQRALARALRHVEAVGAKPDDVQKAYGSLCHTFPVLVRTNGLMQTLAFVYEKSGAQKQGTKDNRQQAHGQLLSDLADVLQLERRDGGHLLNWVKELDNRGYMHATRTVLGAWVYYKRFAVSILNVQPGQAEEAA